MERVFKVSSFERIILSADSIVTIACVIAYLCVDGKELFLALYVPLDAALALSKTAFYWYYFYQDQRQKEEKKLLDEALDSRVENDESNDHQRSLSTSS